MTTTPLPVHLTHSDLAYMQHEAIHKSVTDSARELTHDIGDSGRRVESGLCGLRDVVGQSTMNMRDSLDRNGIATATNFTNLGQSTSDQHRDVLQSVERNAGESRHSSEVSNSNMVQTVTGQHRDILQSVERNAGESRYVGSTQTRDIIGVIDRNSTTLGNCVKDTSYENRSMLLQTRGEILNQGAVQYASLLLEQQKVKEVLSSQLADAKYEALKNKEGLSAQLAASSCETKYEALKNAHDLSKQMAECCCETKEKLYALSSETKYEALKNTQDLSKQMAECCCETKERLCAMSTKMDETVRLLDNNRLRDSLAVAQNEINLLKLLDNKKRDN